MSQPHISWSLDTNPLKAGIHVIETHDGHIREGRITGVDFGEMEVYGRTVRWPVAIHMDGEAERIDWHLIRAIHRVERAD